MLAVLPILGIVLNGTSSVLYGTVPSLAPGGNIGRAFAMFYTGVIGAGAFAPIVYAAIADRTSQTIGILAAALTAAVIIPLVFVRAISVPYQDSIVYLSSIRCFGRRFGIWAESLAC
jgi:MFS transporter, FSR family, fosmidomycin resistance protein